MPAYLNRWLDARMFLIEHPDARLIIWGEQQTATVDSGAFAASFSSDNTSRPSSGILAYVNPQTAQALVRRNIVGPIREVRSSGGYLIGRVYQLDAPAVQKPEDRFGDQLYNALFAR